MLRREKVEGEVREKSLESNLMKVIREKEENEKHLGEKLLVIEVLEARDVAAKDEIEKLRKERVREKEAVEKERVELEVRDLGEKALREKEEYEKDLGETLEVIEGLEVRGVATRGEIEKFRREKAEGEVRERGLERDLTKVFREKEAVEKERVELEVEVDSMKKLISELTIIVDNQKGVLDRVRNERDVAHGELEVLSVEASGLRLRLGEMEKRDVAIQEEIRDLKVCCGGLVKHLEKMEMSTGQAVEEIEKMGVELNELLQEMEEIVDEKMKLEDVKLAPESEVVELHKEVNYLRTVVATLEESCKDQEEENNKLKSELAQKNGFWT